MNGICLAARVLTSNGSICFSEEIRLKEIVVLG